MVNKNDVAYATVGPAQISSIGTRVSDIDADSIIAHVEREYQNSYKVVEAKRKKFRDQEKYYNSTDKSDRIDLHTIYYLVHTQMSLMDADELSVEFLPRIFGGEESAKNMTKIAKFDVEEMELRTMNYEVQLNRLKRGVGIRYYQGFDRNRMCNVWGVVDTRSWIPDVNGWYAKSGFRYEGFEVINSFSSLAQFGYDNVDKLKESIDEETRKSRDADRQASGLATDVEKISGEEVNGNSMVDIYHHFTVYNGHKYHVVLGNNRKVLLAVERLNPVYDSEKKNSMLIPFPTVHNYFSPKPGDPYGTSLVDLVITNHKFKNLFAHLGFIREKEAALGPNVLVNSSIVRDMSIFSTPSVERMWIPVNGNKGGGLDNAFKEAPSTRMQPSNYNYMDLLDRNIEMVSGVDSRQAGINPSRASTLGESNQIQANNNLRSLFQIEINNVGEAEFWKLNIRYYRQHFTASDKKLVRVSNSYGTQLVQFTRDDFISSVDPDVRIVSKSQADSERVRKLSNISPYLMSKMADPNATQLARSEAEREYLELAGVDRDKAVSVYAPLSYEERDALMLVELINANDPDGAIITEENVDHNIYLAIFERAINTPTKRTAIQNRREMVIRLGQNKNRMDEQVMSQQMAQRSSMATAQMMNQNINANASNVVSRADLTSSM